MNGWDLDLFWHINRDWTNPVLDWLMPALSAIDAWLPLLGILLVLLAWRGGRRVRLMLLCLAVSLGVSDAVVGNGLKKICRRVRPRDHMSGVVIRDLAMATPRCLALVEPTTHKLSKAATEPRDGNSMPSNHTVNLFAAATVIALFFRGWGLAVYGLALAVAYSRVYVGAHWPSDLPPSAALGVVVGLVMTHLVVKWIGRKTMPAGAAG
ncbi:MAG: bcrC [Verrucomicrobiaceae bacterium]|nr:bcrC [Verrucomicrobiaceae bacterium]